MKVFVTGAAGFIGSNLCDRLLARGDQVVGFDNLSTGRTEFLADACRSSQFSLVRGDLLDLPGLTSAMAGVEHVYHLAANADVRFGLEHPRKDLEQNTIATFNVLSAMHTNGVKSISFSSTGSIYGESKVVPTPEDAPFPIQTSLYGASKLAGEGLICAFAEGFGIKANIFRFVSIMGPRYTHGHVYDFMIQLRRDPNRLKVLGNGRQKKSYLHVEDCINAIFAVEALREQPRISIYNLGHDTACEVNDSIRWICEELNLKPSLEYSGGERGWVGDNPLILLDNSKVSGIGWKAKNSIEMSVKDTVRWLAANDWVFRSLEQ